MPPTEWMFPNLDLFDPPLQSARRAMGGRDITVTLGLADLRLTRTVLHDQSGSVGPGEQILTFLNR